VTENEADDMGCSAGFDKACSLSFPSLSVRGLRQTGGDLPRESFFSKQNCFGIVSELCQAHHPRPKRSKLEVVGNPRSSGERPNIARGKPYQWNGTPPELEEFRMRRKEPRSGVRT